MTKKLKSLVVVFIVLTLLQLSCLPSYSIDNVSQTNQENQTVNASIPGLIFSGLGLLIGLSITTMILFLEPKSLSANTEFFVNKQSNQDSQTLRVANLYGLVYRFGDFIETQPALVFTNGLPNMFSLDLGVNLNNHNVLNKEKFGISPFLSFGVNGNAYSLVNLGYGFYVKTGITLKIDKLLVDFLAGYRTIDNSVSSVNSFTLGGNIGYKF